MYSGMGSSRCLVPVPGSLPPPSRRSAREENGDEEHPKTQPARLANKTSIKLHHRTMQGATTSKPKYISKKVVPPYSSYSSSDCYGMGEDPEPRSSPEQDHSVASSGSGLVNGYKAKYEEALKSNSNHSSQNHGRSSISSDKSHSSGTSRHCLQSKQDIEADSKYSYGGAPEKTHDPREIKSRSFEEIDSPSKHSVSSKTSFHEERSSSSSGTRSHSSRKPEKRVKDRNPDKNHRHYTTNASSSGSKEKPYVKPGDDEKSQKSAKGVQLVVAKTPGIPATNKDEKSNGNQRPALEKSQSSRLRDGLAEDENTFSTKETRNSSTGSSGYHARTSGITGKEIGLRDEGSNTHRVSLHSDLDDDASASSSTQTIALFGASGMTGSRFLHSALDAGYQVQCLPSDDPRLTAGKTAKPWKILQPEMEDTQQLEILVRGASFVVVMINDLLPKKNSEYPALFLTRLVGKLYALMRREDSMQVFLFQSTSLASNVTGQTPVLSKVVKTATRRKDQFLRDLDSVMKKIATEHCLRPADSAKHNSKNDENQDPNPVAPGFSFIVTRPTILLQNGPGCKRLFASKSQPGPIPISHVDLAEFTLTALTTSKLYNSSPYVVADCF